MDRVAAWCLSLTTLLLSSAATAADAPVVLDTVVDADDDDGDGVADSAQTRNVPSQDLVRLPSSGSRTVRIERIPRGVRVIVDGAPVRAGTTATPSSVRFQAVQPGRHTIELSTGRVQLRAVRFIALDGANRIVDLTGSHASFQRTPPDRLENVEAPTGDPDALRYVVMGHREDLPQHVRLDTRTEEGGRVDELHKAKLVDVPCPAGSPASLACRSSWPIRVVADDIDRGHPLVVERSILGALGGGLTIRAGDLAQQIRIGGPRRTKHGPIQRLRGKMRLTILRTWSGGDACLESRDGAAVEEAREQHRGTTAAWQQCGVTFGSAEKADIRVVDPPPPYLLAVGCDLGLPSSGGKLRVAAGDTHVSVEIPAGLEPAQVARRLASALEEHDLRVVRSTNSRIGPGSYPVVDLMVYRDGQPVELSVPGGGPVSSDPTLPVCIGRVDLAQGLRHFLDVDSMAGTVQERTLLKWIDDRDPSTIDGVFIPAFGGGGGRIGESFIGTDRSSLRNLVLVDRAGVAASKASHTLAHEVGHVLLDVPGHPDDYGVDEPTLLMDSDAANPSAFGPRRLTVAECERMWRQSGPRAPVVMLEPWPFRPLPK